jgi:SAM-dependent methyltransferase
LSANLGTVLPAMSIHAWLRWDAARRMLLPSGSVLEIGCGLGSIGAMLSRKYAYVGVEPDRDAYEVAVRRVNGTGRVLNLTVEDAPVGTFDMVWAFEVLEHIEDDVGAASRWVERVARGGRMIVSVPADPNRFGPTDEKAGHFRRYEPETLRSVLVEAGLIDVQVVAYGFPAGYLLEWGRNLYARGRAAGDMQARTAASGRWLQPRDWMAGGMYAMALPLRVTQRPFTRRGTGLVACGTRA